MVKYKFFGEKLVANQHWSSIKERGSLAGVQFLLLVYKILGKWFFKLFLAPVIFYFYCTGGVTRTAAMDYWRQLTIANNQQQLSTFQLFWHGLKSFYTFGLSILDKFDAWLGRIELEDIEIDDQQEYQKLTSTQGAVVLSTHLGNMEVCRAIFSIGDTKKKLNVITYNEHTPTFNNVLKKINPEAAINFVHINNFGPDDTIKLKQKIEDGEVVVIFADRTSVNNPQSVEYVPFLSKQTPIAIGPFALASIMDCPVFFMACIKNSTSGKYRAYIKHLTDPVKVPRKERKAFFVGLMTKYTECLTYYCKKEPYQWFNFFDFWRTSDQATKEK